MKSMLSVGAAAAVLFALSPVASAQGAPDVTYDWGQNATRQGYQGATSSTPYDWGQSAVDRGYYGDGSARRANRPMSADSLGKGADATTGTTSPTGKPPITRPSGLGSPRIEAGTVRQPAGMASFLGRASSGP